MMPTHTLAPATPGAIAPPPDVEALTQTYGREIFARLNRSGPLLFTPAWFDEQLMNLTMGDPALKVQLFRFIDTLPILRTPEEVSSHLREYLDEAADELPGWMRLGTGLLPRRGPGGRLLAWAAQFNARRMATRFIAGSNVEEAIRAVAALRK